MDNEIKNSQTGMERLNKVERKADVLDERTKNTNTWMEKIERKVDHLIWKFAGANAVLGIVIIMVLKMWK